MDIIKGKTSAELICVHLGPGEKLLESIKEVIATEGITSGVVLSGVGSLQDVHFHQTNAGFPPNLLTRHQDFRHVQGSYELASMQGLIVDGEPHLHITVSEANHTVSGHLENETIVLTLVELVILKAESIPATRRVSQPEKIKELKPL